MEIKFRGKRIDNGKLVYGFYRKNTFFNRFDNPPSAIYSKHFIGSFDNLNFFDGIFEQVEVEESSIGIYIGVKDLKEKEVYVGDRVKGRFFIQKSLNPDLEPEIKHFEGIVSFAEGCFFVKGDNGECVFSFTYPDFELEVINQ